MHKTAIIPARYGSTRLPVKPLRLIAGLSLINRVYDAVDQTNLFDRIIIATDHEDIVQHVKSFQGEVMLTSPNNPTGTDRVEECARLLNTDLVVNIQGDEPFITREPLELLIDSFQNSQVHIGSIMSIFTREDEITNPNCVKVIVDRNFDALYFSRAVIPYNRDANTSIVYYKHFGIYAFRPLMLKLFVSLPQGILEQIEKLEQLRFLENGYKIKMVLTNYNGIGIDTPNDLQIAELRLNNCP